MVHPVRPFSESEVRELFEFLEREIASETRERSRAIASGDFEYAYHRKMELAALNRVYAKCVRLLRLGPCTGERG